MGPCGRDAFSFPELVEGVPRRNVVRQLMQCIQISCVRVAITHVQQPRRARVHRFSPTEPDGMMRGRAALRFNDAVFGTCHRRRCTSTKKQMEPGYHDWKC